MDKDERYLNEVKGILDREYNRSGQDEILIKCEKCGNLGVPELESKVRGRDWVFGLALLPAGGLGALYLFWRWACVTGNPQRRKLVCPICGRVYPGQGKSMLDRSKEAIAKIKNIRKPVVSMEDLQQAVIIEDE